jgi:hypothetical protein
MRTPHVFILLVALALSACQPGNSNNRNAINGNANTAPRVVTAFPPLVPGSKIDPNFKVCNIYYSLVPGSRRRYVISYSSGITADAVAVVDPWEENGRKGFKELIQIVDSTGGYQIKQQIERHYVCDGEKVQQLYEKTDSDVEGNKTTTEFLFRDNAYAMIEPASLKPGATWSYTLKSKIQPVGQPATESDVPTAVNFTVVDEEELQLPTGKVNALKVFRKVGEAEIYDYFAPGLGFVKRTSKEGTGWELKEYSGLKPVDNSGK